MKTKLFALAFICVSTGAFAQGKINMVNDSTRLVYFAATLPADAAFYGQKVPAVLPSGITLMVDLYGGTTQDSMTLQRTTVINPAIPGSFGPITFTSVNLPGDVDAFFQIQVRDSAYPTAQLAMLGGSYIGFSQIFTMRPGTSIAFNAINNPGGTALSTWQPGTYDLGGGEFGAIVIPLIPEPSSLAILGVGAACFQFFRRRR
ncbi:MAG: PEP-CTERM sorting domain-containing protein [Verrucomicrobia bacterium]|nr:PEP-CTERM sorting domain-containing protein [Verrucomicrobiota bacterium]